MIEVIIERTLNGKFIVSEANEYFTPVHRTKTQKRGLNIFGGELDDLTYEITHKEMRYKAGDALSSSSDYNDCLKFIKDNNLKLIHYPLHSAFYTELDSRSFRK